MMSNVWYSIVRFLQKLFVPTETSAFERYLVGQVSYLEGEISRQRQEYEEKYERLLERFVPGNNRPEPSAADVKVIGNSKPTWPERRRALEESSRQREQHWRSVI